jgi:2-dehydro-3-deoxyphosphogluconate aldolase / (4S)-4-hydroxy-2-oxoglutarate aldolase
MTSHLESALAHRVLPLAILNEAAHADSIAEALGRAGLPVVEVAMRTPAALEAINRMARHGDLKVGAGTVITPDDVNAVVAAGASFVVSPGLSEPVISRCRQLGVPVLPGAVTPSEVMRALDLGLDILKFFPAAAAGGVATVAALAGPFPHLRLVPTGGIDAKSAADYGRLTNVAAVGGSWMLPAPMVVAGNIEGLAQAITAARNSLAGRPA